jgi:glycosyltransferase involved in cell wall biosynthesis/SAM-dependent methyltransferase
VKLLFVSHYFYPEVGAAQTRILETAQCLSARGHDVSVLTGFPNYPDGVIAEGYRGHVVLRERIGEVQVIRTAVYPAPNRGFARRLLNHASFALSSIVASPLAGRCSVVIAETPPLFTAVAAVFIAKARRAPLVLNVSDLWPESAVQLGALRNPRAIATAEALERFAYRHSASITVPTAGMRATLLDRGQPADKVVQLPNAVDADRFVVPGTWNTQLRRVIYCGTIGMAQGLDTLIDAAAELKSAHQQFEFLLVGDGAERAELAEKARERGLANVRFVGRVDRERVPELIASADIAVLCLRDVPLFEDALPTKMLEYMAAGRPVVASAAGDVARLLVRAQAGVTCPPEDPAALAAAIRHVASSPERARIMGANGRRYVRAHHSREAFVSALEAIIWRLAGDEREHARIRRVYQSIETSQARRRAWSPTNPGNRRITAALYAAVREALAATGAFPSDGRVLLDVGCGYGDLLGWLSGAGADPSCLRGVDILEERVTAAQRRVAKVAFEAGDARALPYPPRSVDAVLLFTVLSSVLGRDDRRRVALEAIRVLRPGGVILCYDMRYRNPWNLTVRPIGRRELGRLFPRCVVETRSLTLLPPLARRLGRATEALYDPLSAVAPLRTHLLAVVRPAPS